MEHQVTTFKTYAFKKGQKIRIEGSQRSGDWLVADTSDYKVTLECPITKKQFTWTKFCYHVEDKIMEWPQE